MAAPVVTVSVFTFADGQQTKGFLSMAGARPLLRNVAGLQFHKMMGAGRGLGFTRRPDWRRYAFLGAWSDLSAARAFLTSSQFFRYYRRRVERTATLVLRPVAAHGTWDRRRPFEVDDTTRIGPDDRVCVLTRATIRIGSIRAFWRMVPPVSAELGAAEGLIASIGVGELPLLRQATVSVWESVTAMEHFAYSAERHREVVRRTRDENWYAEELFARFALIEEHGTFP